MNNKKTIFNQHCTISDRSTARTGKVVLLLPFLTLS